MSSRRRCASSRCPPVPTRARARRRHRFRARTRGRGVARARGDPRGSRTHREPRRRVIGAPATGIARRARLGRGRPRSVRASHDCFLHQPGNSRRGVCPSAAPRTPADPASSPRSIRRLSPRARRSAPSSVISRYVSAPLREAPNPHRYVFATWCPVSLREGRNGEASEAFEPPRRATRARRRSRAAPLGEENRASPRPRRSGRRADHRARLLRAPPRVPAGAMEAVARSIQTGYRTDPALERRAPFVSVTWRVKTQRRFFFERARKKSAAAAPFVSARAFC